MSDRSKDSFSKKVPMGRPGQPIEIATCFVFLASMNSSLPGESRRLELVKLETENGIT